jgi:hypothetical protein
MHLQFPAISLREITGNFTRYPEFRPFTVNSAAMGDFSFEILHHAMTMTLKPKTVMPNPAPNRPDDSTAAQPSYRRAPIFA